MRSFNIPGVELRSTKVVSLDNEDFLDAVFGEVKFKSHYRSCSEVLSVGRERYPVASVSQLVQTVHLAFDNHFPLALAPEMFWYAICHEVTRFIKSDPNSVAKYFTSTPGEKQHIEIDAPLLVYGGKNDWAGTIEVFRKPLKERVPKHTTDLFFPPFSTMTPEKETAILVAFMDMVSSYYSFGMHTMCGIPSVRLEGETKDWEILLQYTVTLSEIFTGLGGYFADLIPVLKKIVDTARGGDIDESFWKSIYKFQDDSGGPYVTGWITALMAYEPRYRRGEPVKWELKQKFDWKSLIKSHFGGYSTNAFPSHISTVDVRWNYLGKEIPMLFAAGFMGSEVADGFVAPKLGFGVFEYKK